MKSTIRIMHHAKQPQCTGPWCDTHPDRETPNPFHAASDLDRVTLEHTRNRGVRCFLLATAVTTAIVSAAMLVLVAVLWGAS